MQERKSSLGGQELLAKQKRHRLGIAQSQKYPEPIVVDGTKDKRVSECLIYERAGPKSTHKGTGSKEKKKCRSKKNSRNPSTVGVKKTTKQKGGATTNTFD